jgi:hypothetical protein
MPVVSYATGAGDGLRDSGSIDGRYGRRNGSGTRARRRPMVIARRLVSAVLSPSGCLTERPLLWQARQLINLVEQTGEVGRQH